MDSSPFDYSKRQYELIESVILFVYEYICKWRDDPKRKKEESEKILNSDLPKYLTVSAHKAEREFVFYPEEPEEDQRTIDFSVCYNDIKCYNEKITVFECKRLSKEITGKRKDEYVTGHDKISGGIQRFKLEVHGKEHDIVGMIGYIQTGNASDWFYTINNTIENLCGKIDGNGLNWTTDELLTVIDNNSKRRKQNLKSTHPRKSKADITIHHLWIDMQKGDSNE